MRHSFTALLTGGVLLAVSPALAQSKYDPGASDAEIKLGQTIPYSGPASAFSPYGRVWVAYFKMLNGRGGINGRKVNVLSLDNAFSPPKAVEQSRKLVEDDGVLAEVGTVGTPPNAATQKYLNDKKVPQLLVSAGGSRFNDPKNFPWTVPFYPTFDREATVYAKHILQTKPEGKLAVLYQNDDYGRDFLKGLKEGLGDKAAKMIVAEASYALTDATVDSQVLTLRASGADIFLQFTTPKFAAQAIRAIHTSGWKPVHYVVSPSAGIQTTLAPAGLEASVDIITAQFAKVPDDPTWADAKDLKDYMAFMKQWAPGDNPNDFLPVSGYLNAQMAAIVLERCKNDLTRENLIKQATTLNGIELGMLLPGIKISNAPNDYRAFHQFQLARFDGKAWARLGNLIDLREASR
jgi:branched-chain amino acid transport system substrate-binding protein